MKSFRLVQHWLIPITLVSANAAFIHLLYLLSLKGIHLQALCLFLCLTWLITGIVIKNKYLLISGTVIYWVMLTVMLADCSFR